MNMNFVLAMTICQICFSLNVLAVNYIDFSSDTKELNTQKYMRRESSKVIDAEKRIKRVVNKSVFYGQENMLFSIAGDDYIFNKAYNSLYDFGPMSLSEAQLQIPEISEILGRITENKCIGKMMSHNEKHTKQFQHDVSGWEFICTKMPWQWKQMVLSGKKTVKNFINNFDPTISAIIYDGDLSIQLSAIITRGDFIRTVQGIQNVTIKNESGFFNLVLSIKHDNLKNEIHISHFYPNEQKNRRSSI